MLTFLVISLVVIVTPGPDTALTIRNVFAGGRRAGCATALGVATGQLAWAIATSLGLASLLIASKPALYAVRLLGAAYLIFLGVQSLRQAFARGAMSVLDGRPANGPMLGPWRAFGQGLLNNLANPKMAVFFASVLPQFAAPSQGMLSQLVLLGGIFALLTLTWLSLYSVVLSLAGRWMRNAGVSRTIDSVAGSALIALGLRVAVGDPYVSG